jgi:hypothetical protein
MRVRRFGVLATIALLWLVAALGTAAPAQARGRLDTSKGSASFTFSAKANATHGRLPAVADDWCWVFQDTYVFGNAVADQGSGTFHIQWCANTAKTKVTSFTAGQFWCTRGPVGFWTYENCDKHHGSVPAVTRASYIVHWYFHFCATVCAQKTLTVSGFVYSNGGIDGTVTVG